jgi:hypothetical protein
VALTLKYPVEFFLEFRSVDRFLYRVSDLYQLDKVTSQEVLARLDNCHVYLLGKRPRLSILPDSVHATAKGVRFVVEYRLGSTTHHSPVEIPRSYLRPEEKLFGASSYPHRELISYSANGDVLGYTLLANIVHIMPSVRQEARDLEVVYVGKGVRRSAQDRLENHATLQRLLAEINSNEPDAEVFSIVYSFKYLKNALALKGSSAEFDGTVARKHREKALKFQISLDEQVSLIEASIISYFQPTEYNMHYLDFPSRRHQILRKVYDSDFAAIVVQLDNTNIGGLRLYSKTVQPDSTHDIIADFRRLERRSSLFDRRTRNF